MGGRSIALAVLTLSWVLTSSNASSYEQQSFQALVRLRQAYADGDAPQIAVAHRAMADAMYEDGRLDDAIANLRSALAHLQPDASPNDEIALQAKLISILSEKDERDAFRSALANFDQHFPLAKDPLIQASRCQSEWRWNATPTGIPCPEAIAIVSNLLLRNPGTLEFSQIYSLVRLEANYGRYDIAREIIKKVLTSEQVKDKQRVTEAFAGLRFQLDVASGQVEAVAALVVPQLEQIQRTLLLSNDTGFYLADDRRVALRNKAILMLQLARTNLNAGRLKDGLEQLRKVLNDDELGRAQQDEERLTLRLELANWEFRAGQTNSAFSNASQVLTLSNIDVSTQALAKLLIGQIHGIRGNLELAKENITQAETIFANYGDPLSPARISAINQLVHVLAQSGDYRDALKYATQAVELQTKLHEASGVEMPEALLFVRIQRAWLNAMTGNTVDSQSELESLRINGNQALAQFRDHATVALELANASAKHDASTLSSLTRRLSNKFSSEEQFSIARLGFLTVARFIDIEISNSRFSAKSLPRTLLDAYVSSAERLFPNQWPVGHALMRRAEALHRFGRSADSLADIRRAIEISNFGNSGVPAVTANKLKLIEAEILLRLGKTSTAKQLTIELARWIENQVRPPNDLNVAIAAMKDKLFISTLPAVSIGPEQQLAIPIEITKIPNASELLNKIRAEIDNDQMALAGNHINSLIELLSASHGGVSAHVGTVLAEIALYLYLNGQSYDIPYLVKYAGLNKTWNPREATLLVAGAKLIPDLDDLERRRLVDSAIELASKDLDLARRTKVLIFATQVLLEIDANSNASRSDETLASALASALQTRKPAAVIEDVLPALRDILDRRGKAARLLEPAISAMASSSPSTAIDLLTVARDYSEHNDSVHFSDQLLGILATIEGFGSKRALPHLETAAELIVEQRPLDAVWLREMILEASGHDNATNSASNLVLMSRLLEARIAARYKQGESVEPLGDELERIATRLFALDEVGPLPDSLPKAIDTLSERSSKAGLHGATQLDQWLVKHGSESVHFRALGRLAEDGQPTPAVEASKKLINTFSSTPKKQASRAHRLLRSLLRSLARGQHWQYVYELTEKTLSELPKNDSSAKDFALLNIQARLEAGDVNGAASRAESILAFWKEENQKQSYSDESFTEELANEFRRHVILATQAGNVSDAETTAKHFLRLASLATGKFKEKAVLTVAGNAICRRNYEEAKQILASAIGSPNGAELMPQVAISPIPAPSGITQMLARLAMEAGDRQEALRIAKQLRQEEEKLQQYMQKNGYAPPIYSPANRFISDLALTADEPEVAYEELSRRIRSGEFIGTEAISILDRLVQKRGNDSAIPMIWDVETLLATSSFSPQIPTYFFRQYLFELARQANAHELALALARHLYIEASKTREVLTKIKPSFGRYGATFTQSSEPSLALGALDSAFRVAERNGWSTELQNEVFLWAQSAQRREVGQDLYRATLRFFSNPEISDRLEQIHRLEAEAETSMPSTYNINDEKADGGFSRYRSIELLAALPCDPIDLRRLKRERDETHVLPTDTTSKEERDRRDTLQRKRKALEQIFVRLAGRLDDKPVPLHEAQASLSNDETILIALSDAPYPLSVAATRNDFIAKRIEANSGAAKATLAENIRILKTQIQDTSDDTYNDQVASSVYASVFGPIQKQLRPNILLSISGPLAGVPVGLLLTKPVESDAVGDFKRYPWFDLQYSVEIVPSVAAVTAVRHDAPNQSDGQSTFLGIADPDLSQTGYIPVTGGADVLTAIKSAASGTGEVISGQDATPAELMRRSKTGQLKKYRIVAFMTHGLLASETNSAFGINDPALLLSSEKPNDVQSGLLTATKIAQLSMRCDLVIVAACNSASGASDTGENLSGIAKAFMQSGARSLLVSYWYVELQPTQDLLSRLAVLVFQKKAAIRDALRETMQWMRNDNEYRYANVFAHPRYWASFSYVSDGHR